MIYIIIGASHSGKSSFVYNSWIKNKHATCKKDLVVLTETDSAFLIGNFLVENRRKGTDLIARQDIKKFSEQVDRLYETKKDIVLDGAKACSRPFINYLLSKNYEITLYYLNCSLEVSVKRNNSFSGSNTTLKALKTAHTLARNFYLEYRDLIQTYVIDSENVKDFTTFDITYPAKLYKSQKLI